jgi:hypothetical protein
MLARGAYLREALNAHCYVLDLQSFNAPGEYYVAP